ncbi:MAG: replication initiator protein [Microvirus sp.]|nr:MAG: replication initiator protein [Microvirus sp.]
MKCLRPKNIGNPKTGEQITVRCLRCYPCQQFRAQNWTIRLSEESRHSIGNWFITLTLADEHLTYSDYNPTLSKRDLQLFWKRLRKKAESIHHKIKYYAVGEYGSETKRPHYHAILFNTKIKDKDLIEAMVKYSWEKGHIFIGDVTPLSIRYVAGYLEKGIYGERLTEGILREFNCMSKQLGISYVNQNKSYHEQNKNFNYGRSELPKALPRYYREKIFSPDDLVQFSQQIKESYTAQTIKQEEDDYVARLNRVKSIRSLNKKRL